LWAVPGVGEGHPPGGKEAKNPGGCSGGEERGAKHGPLIFKGSDIRNETVHTNDEKKDTFLHGTCNTLCRVRSQTAISYIPLALWERVGVRV